MSTNPLKIARQWELVKDQIPRAEPGTGHAKAFELGWQACENKLEVKPENKIWAVRVKHIALGGMRQYEDTMWLVRVETEQIALDWVVGSVGISRTFLEVESLEDYMKDLGGPLDGTRMMRVECGENW